MCRMGFAIGRRDGNGHKLTRRGIHGHFTRAPYYIVLKLGKTGTDIEDFYHNEFLSEKQHIGVKLARVLVDYKIDLLFTANIGEISYHILRDNLVDVYKVDEDNTVSNIIERHRLKQLRPLADHTHTVEESQVINRLKDQGRLGAGL